MYEEGEEARHPILSKSNQSSLPELPPAYTAFDDSITSFSLSAPLIHTISADQTLRPRYQLSQQLTKSGKLWRLLVRRLLPSESRRLAIPGRNVRFDKDALLYLIENIGGLGQFGLSSMDKCRVQIRGRKAGTLRGYIEMSQQSGRDRETCVFRHCVKSVKNDALREENQKKIQKYGYHADDEWEKKILFSTRGVKEGVVEWTGEMGEVMASENGDVLNIEAKVTERIRDTLVTCWAAKRWAALTLSWEDSSGAASPQKSTNYVYST